MSHFQIPVTSQSNSRYGGSAFYSANNSFQKSQLNYSSNSSFNGVPPPSSMLYHAKTKKIPSKNSWNHTFSIPIQCGKSNYENPDLELWKDPHVTKLQTGNSRRIVCGGLSWDIYIHPNQGENSNQFALSCFPVKSASEDRLPENYKLKYTVSTSLNPRGSPQIAQMNDDQKSISVFDVSWHRELSHIVYDANPNDITSQQRQDIDWRATMERLPFSIMDLIQYNCDEDNDYFNLYIQIKTEFIRKPAKRSQYVGVLGAILLGTELELQEKEKIIQAKATKIQQLNHKRDSFIMELQKQLQTANKLNFQLTDQYSKLQLSIDKYASEMQELRQEIQNISNRHKQIVIKKEKTILHLQDDIVSKQADITELNQQISKLKITHQNNDQFSTMLQNSFAQQQHTQQILQQQQRVQQQEQFKQQLLEQQRINARMQQQQFERHPFGPQPPVSSTAPVASNYNAFVAPQPPVPPNTTNNMNNINNINTTVTAAVMDPSPQSVSMSHSLQQSPSYQARVVSQPSFNTKSTSAGGGGGGMTSSPPQMHSSNLMESFSFGTISPNKETQNMPELERTEEKKQAQAPLEPLPHTQSASHSGTTGTTSDTSRGQTTGQTTRDNSRIFDTSATDQEPVIVDTINAAHEDQIWQHRPAKAWRYDKDQEKWRGRGKGQLTIYFHQEKEMAKIVFMDEKHDKTRLLQWIDGSTPCEMSICQDDNKKDSVEWHGSDYTMDQYSKPMIGRWKLCFMDDAEAAQSFIEVFNRCIDDLLATRSMNSKETTKDINEEEDQASESSTKPFSFEVIDGNKKPESFVNEDPLAFNTFNADTVAGWTDTFKQSETGNTNTSGSFANMDWNFQAPQQAASSSKVEQETTDNKEKVEDDNGMEATFKPIVQLEEQTVDTGHENETLIGEVPFVKLYRFGKDVASMSCWKIRASKSTVFFYKSSTNGKIRMIAREQETSKLRMNQFVPKSEDANFGTKQNNAYQWKAYDSSIAAEEQDDNAGFTMWCIKFVDAAHAETFATEFKKAMQVNDSISGVYNPNDNDNNKNETNNNAQANEDTNEVQPTMGMFSISTTQNHVNDEAEEEAEETRYKGWTDEEIAADKQRIEKAKRDEEQAKLFQGSSEANENQVTQWEMPSDLFAFNKSDKPSANVFGAEYDFEKQRGVDLEAEKVLNRIQTDTSISFGVASGTNDADESSNVAQDFSNITTRDTPQNTAEDTTVVSKDSTKEQPQESGLGLANFSFDADTEEPLGAVTTWDDTSRGFSSGKPADTEEASAATWADTSRGFSTVKPAATEEESSTAAVATWGDNSGGFSSVKPTDGFANVNWATNDSGSFGSFGDSTAFTIDTLMSDTKRENLAADASPNKADNALDFKIKTGEDANENEAEDNGNYTLKPIVSLEEVEVESGHDNEKLLDEFAVVKLYRWGKDVAQQPCWKTRAQKTNVKFYQDNESGRIRMVCRENITNKLRLNQNVAPPEIATLEKKSEKQIGWSGFDVTIAAEDGDETCGLPCVFAAKFMDEETATNFYNFFKSSSGNNVNLAAAAGK